MFPKCCVTQRFHHLYLFTRVHSSLTLARETLTGIDGNIILVESRKVRTRPMILLAP